MADEVTAGPAVLVAAEAVVVLFARDPDLVVELGHVAVVGQLLPWMVGVDHARVQGPFNDLPRGACSVVIEVQGFHYQRIGSRPGKAERQDNPGFFIPQSHFRSKCIPSEYGRRSSSKTTRPSDRRDTTHVFLQTNFEISITFILALSVIRVPCPITAQAVLQFAIHVLHR